MLREKAINLVNRSIRQNKALTLILIIAALLRFIGVYPGYHPYHSDEGMSYSSAMEMIRNLSIDPGRYDYPSLIPLIHAIAYILLFIPVFIIKSLLFNPEDLPTKGKNVIELWQQVVLQNQQTHVLFWGRYITAAFGVGVVFLVYLVAKSFFATKDESTSGRGRKIALAAAFLTAVNFRQVLNSHLGLPDIYNAFFLLLAIFSFSILLKQGTLKNYLLSGISIGLFFSTKLQTFLLPGFLTVHAFVVWVTTTNKTSKNLVKSFFNKGFLIGLLIIPIVILLVNPYHLIKWEEFRAQEGYNLLKYRLGVNSLNIFPISYLYHIGLGQAISLFIIFGAFLSLLRYSRSTLILLSIVLPFLYFFFYYSGGGYYTRNFVTITPLLLIFAGVFTIEACEFLLRGKIFSNIAIVVILLFISFESINNSLTNAYYFSKPWGFKDANAWARINIPEGIKLVSHPWDNYPRDKELAIIPFEVGEVFSVSEMREEGAQYGFLNFDWLTLGSYWWMNRSTKNPLEFWEKPNDLLSNTYQGVAAQELASFAVQKFVKPWQAPDMNFLIVKIPPKPEIPDKVLVSNFSFEKEEDLSSWNLIDGDFREAKKILFDSKIGKDSPSSLKFEGGGRRFPVVRATSQILPVSEGRAIIVEGWIKSGDILTKKARDGFLRIDFFKDQTEITLLTASLQSNVSSRFFGGTDWEMQELIVFPPKEAKFMTVGMQVNNYGEFWFDDLKIYQSEEQVEDPRQAEPYIDYRIPDDILFPYSQGGL